MNSNDPFESGILGFVFRNFGKFWLASLVLGLGILGFGIWAIYTLVTHVTVG